MATNNSRIIEENLEEALYRIEFRVPYKIVKVLDKKLELEQTTKADYIRQLLIKDLKGIIREEKGEKLEIKNSFVELLELTNSTKELITATNKLGGLINQLIKYDILGIVKDTNINTLMKDFYIAHSDVRILLEDYQNLLKKGE
jgi:hypothetical protein